ncbi:Sugar fermentation stimulation protein A [Caldalkalibacillus thermarum TA2.A1]|uniref:Sugar fermentation stimulation protein homolog n=1 Tax=Caldalkalibacillus thermarum (strain TA2.A1) TaxID=986075 RepID=F5L830_CALTT|nr:DNA/RNA nuclease SfsA [Caldalkalibacillus thermarum]EGL82538.1 Sugar fermentation stimulation protein A [Caldalkalibacillus thermarum TA2.A1]QZT33034.1 DNA/RNA nuclease SfsA [Caldalkalibacillus thermarum TA2.A1]
MQNKKENNVSISYHGSLYQARFIERPNRFVVRCELLGQSQKGTSVNDPGLAKNVVEAHLPDPGRLKELLVPGRTLWLKASNKPERKTKWSVVFCETPGGKSLVSLDSTLPNRLITLALKANAIEELRDWSLVQPEFKMGGSRWDFLLTHIRDGRKLALEIKSVTLVRNKIALFPDAVTLRGTKHLRELAHLARKTEWEAAVLFVVQRDDVIRVEAARDIDPCFADELEKARASGVQLLGRKCHITLNEVTLGGKVPVITGSPIKQTM